MLKLEEAFAAAKIIPLVTLDDADDAVPMAKALMAGGLNVLEVTLRTPASLAALEKIAKVDGAIVGAGTVLSAADVESASEAGAQFLISPGFRGRLARAAADARLPFLPGVATATEIMRARDVGLSLLKFFPAEAAGGAKSVKAFAGPFPGVRFCPTGGVDAGNARDYLNLPNVVCVGGSWMTPRDAIAAKDWAKITALAKAAKEAVA
ncbi:MAG: bifunctional 4-hydroxy-2-oxoglutarate aldolase/2-dehydro-3-deoxy-phosphogluconate aldolase [Hyphomonadaceae bacterium]|nr:bifunctional 4-hydroxy-2-oxoglutarate aldolase/2-dehydro-3-deoxy-phosphogluconate aldolase [Hyphomonadaceae bacterium]